MLDSFKADFYTGCMLTAVTFTDDQKDNMRTVEAVMEQVRQNNNHRQTVLNFSQTVTQGRIRILFRMGAPAGEYGEISGDDATLTELTFDLHRIVQVQEEIVDPLQETIVNYDLSHDSHS